MVIFLKASTITPEMVELSGLDIVPKLDKKKNVKYASNNFQEFLAQYPKISKFNIWIKLLKTMCEDSQQGIKYDSGIYLVKYKNIFNRFVGFIFLSSFLPLVIIEIVYVVPNQFIIMHTICLFLVFVLHRILCYKFEKFQDIFYKNWYDNILNFDLFAVNEIKSFILNSSDNNELIDAINNLAEIDQKLADILINNTKDMSSKIEKLINLQESNKEITYQNITESLDRNITQIQELGSVYDDISSKIDSSLNHLINVTNSKKKDVDAINKNSASLLELKKEFSEYKSKALDTETTHMKNMVTTLNETINGTFSSIETTIKSYSEKLSNSYDSFYNICATFIQMFSQNNNDVIMDLLKTLNGNILEKTKKYDENISLLEKAIIDTSNSTTKICEYLFNFSQFTQSPLFMEEIKNNINFQKEIVKASKNLISYQKLVKVYEQKYDVSYAEKITQLNKLLFKVAKDVEDLKNDREIQG
jgi:hypothetical protein